MGVSLLLSQERWQTFVSFGFDHIISGFCYLIRQKFKLTSFSLACCWVSCTVWSGFGSFSSGGRRRKLLFGSCRGKEGEPFTCVPGATSAPQKRSAVRSCHSSRAGWGLSSGPGRGLAFCSQRRPRGEREGEFTVIAVFKSRSHFTGRPNALSA